MWWCWRQESSLPREAPTVDSWSLWSRLVSASVTFVVVYVQNSSVAGLFRPRSRQAAYTAWCRLKPRLPEGMPSWPLLRLLQVPLLHGREGVVAAVLLEQLGFRSPAQAGAAARARAPLAAVPEVDCGLGVHGPPAIELGSVFDRFPAAAGALRTPLARVAARLGDLRRRAPGGGAVASLLPLLLGGLDKGHAHPRWHTQRERRQLFGGERTHRGRWASESVLDGLHPFLALLGAGGLKIQSLHLALGCRPSKMGCGENSQLV